MSILKWIAARLKERTTWLGIAGLLSTAGVAIAPELQEAIVSAGVALAGLVLVVTKDKE